MLASDRHRTFVLARAGEGFSDEDLEVGRRLQPLLVPLERQARVLGRETAPPPDAPGHDLLSGCERAVLVLLDRGRTADAIGRELGISPRTVHKHLEHLYRKLGVSDRLRAVMVARGTSPQRARRWSSAAARRRLGRTGGSARQQLARE